MADFVSADLGLHLHSFSPWALSPLSDAPPARTRLELPQAADAVRRKVLGFDPAIDGVLGHTDVLRNLLN
jgi:hypothetical protein